MKDCQLHPFERNRYFYGKLLTVRDFEMEQRYYMEKDRLINRLIHGIGIAYGLEVKNPKLESDGRLTVELTRGAALDCCGNEIIVSRNAIMNTYGNYVDGINYIYIKYAECEKEPVPSPANSSACEETCCNSRIQESFQVLVSPEPPENVYEPIGEDINWDPGDEQVRPYLTGQNRRVLLAVMNIDRHDVSVDLNKTKEFRDIVYHNPLLHYLFTCLKKSLDSHLNDTDNPHGTTATQVGALVSIDGVSNPGGNVDLLSNNSITINPNHTTKTIRIGETHSGVTGNPHNTQHAQTNPASVNPVSSDTARDKHVSDADGLRWNRALTGIQVNGETVLENSGGAVNLVAGKNVELIPDVKKKTVTISADGGASAPAARMGRVTIKTDEKGYGSVTVDSGFDDNKFFVYLGLEHKGFVEYGPSLNFAGHVLNPVVRVYNETILPTLGPTILPTRGPLNPTGNFSIIIDVPKLGANSVPICWVAVPAMTHLIPTIGPTIGPTIIPTINPTIIPTIKPTINPTINPIIVPTIKPTINPTIVPTINPTIIPTINPTINPTIVPTINPTIIPTTRPTIVPTINPTMLPTISPTIKPVFEVNGIDETHAIRLTQNGISNLKELAEVEPAKISEILGVSEVKAMSFIDEARRLLGQ